MNTWKAFQQGLTTATGAALLAVLNLGAAFAAPLNIKDEPLFLNAVPPPLNMLVLSRDHRMYYEAYNDASDLDGDGVLDTTYKTDKDFTYYGYFDSNRCYSYAGGVFTPGGAAAEKKCPGSWSGDWLNYVTMSRIDALRKVLYGGLRSTDTAASTVLQRAFIPQDAHSWGKEYTSTAINGYDIHDYTPYGQPAAGRHHLFANTTPSASAVVTGNANPAINGVGLPLLRVLTDRNNRIWDWLSSERLVANSEIHQGPQTGGVTPEDFVVRVQVCSTGTFETDKATNCKVYGTGNAKPTGLLQDYGENDSMYFGLLSGSYGKPHDGGVLRKAVSSLKNEIDLANGVFVYSLSPPGIINTIDRLRITNFNWDSYGCGWITDSSDAAGSCSMWGNPTAEMMYEVARYYAGKTGATAAFDGGANNWEETGIGLGVATWNSGTDPYRTFPHCSKPFETVVSDISPSFDSDKVPGSSFTGYGGDISMNAGTLGDKIWDQEIGGTGRYFIGQSGAVYDGAPTVKDVSSFGNIRGLAPEGPTKEGSYNSAAVAYYSLEHDLNGAAGDQKMQTFAVALASPLPQIKIPVNGRTVTLVPFAKSVAGSGINGSQGAYQPTNQIVDFYVDTLTPTYGKFRVNFEDVEQGADHDMDAISVYEYQVNAGSVDITVTSEYAAGGIVQHMGYVISGTTQDGTYLVVRDVDTSAGGDPDYFLDTPPGQPPGGNWADGQPLPAGTANPVTRNFLPGSADGAGLLKDPLYYAAKWGGFDDTKGNNNGVPDTNAEWDVDNDGVPDNYFLVTNALKLKQQLGQAFASIIDRAGSASAAAVSSGSISDDTRVFQATFDARFWGGHLYSYKVGTGAGGTTEGQLLASEWDAATQVPAPNLRHIMTVSPVVAGGTTGIYQDAVRFRSATIGPIRTLQLDRGDGLGDQRLDWLRGDRSNETPSGAKLRKRNSVLGDIVNSSPVFVGAPNQRYPNAIAPSSYSAFRTAQASRAKTIYTGANDGMLHAFDATTGEERFGFIPHSVFSRLYKLTDPNYAHEFYVDGTPTVLDAYVGGAWRTVLAAGLNKGGQGVFALDVTNPVVTEADADSLFMWEFTDAEDADLGYTYSRPSIVKMRDGTWVAIFGNGYNNTDNNYGLDTNVSATGNAVLYIVNLATGALLRKIDTGVGMAQDPKGQSRPNGLATPNAIDLDGDRVIDYVYAGDLFGNVWKFDVTDVNPLNWDVAYRSGGTALPLFKAVNAGGVPQPITERVQVGFGPKGNGALVLVGTGKFLEPGDRNSATLSTQSFYGLYDRMSGTVTDIIPSDRSTLVQQSILTEVAATLDGRAVQARTTTANPVDPAAKTGWYMDLISPVAGFQGEMQVTDPIIRNGRVLFTTLIPDPDICAFGGRSWLMDIDALSGAKLSKSPFDLSVTGASGFSEGAIMNRLGMLTGASGNAYGIDTTSDAGIRSIKVDDGPGALGRQSWRQLR
jgi:type IV pilus assembly protein PilY1